MRSPYLATAVLSTFTLMAAVGCARTTCEKYAEMEWRCSGYPASEEDMTKQLAQGMCEGAKTFEEPEVKQFADHLRRESECAARFFDRDRPDCAGYKACAGAIEDAEPVEITGT